LSTEISMIMLQSILWKIISKKNLIEQSKTKRAKVS